MVPTIINRSACRGEKRGNSAPKRAMSYRPAIALMYSMPQHAVTNGYWKMLFFRAQPSAFERFFSKNPMVSSSRPSITGTLFSSPPSRADSGTLPSGRNIGSFISGAPLERALAPHVNEADPERDHERKHLEVGEPAEAFAVQVAKERAPRVDEDAFDVEDDEEQCHQVELDRMSRVRVAGRRRSALERRLLDREDTPRTEHGREDADRHAENAGDDQQHQDREVRREVVQRGKLPSGRRKIAADGSGVNAVSQEQEQSQREEGDGCAGQQAVWKVD